MMTYKSALMIILTLVAYCPADVWTGVYPMVAYYSVAI